MSATTGPNPGSARPTGHPEGHRSSRGGWLRAGVLGANDGLLSTAALLVGVAAAGANRTTLLTTGFASIAAGALSMAAGEYGSVASQLDTERADLERERRELEENPAAELAELTRLQRARGLSPELARSAAEELTAADAFTAHAREELGLDPTSLARPTQAAVTSATSFALGAAVPVAAAALFPASIRIWAITLLAVVGLVALGATGAHLGGAPKGRAALRIAVLGVAALIATQLIGRLTGTTLG